MNIYHPFFSSRVIFLLNLLLGFTVRAILDVVLRDCLCCPHMLRGDMIRSTVDDRTYSINRFYNCNTVNVQYVGRTTHMLKYRFREHLADIRGCKSTNVSPYFISMHEGDLSLVQVQILKKVRIPSRGGDVFHLLCKRELFWIFKLQSRIRGS